MQNQQQFCNINHQILKNKEFFIYSIVSKESNSGLLTHNRLLVLDSADKTLKYYSNIPKYPLEQIPKQSPKQIVQINQINNKFQFNQTGKKIGNVQITWIQNNQKKIWNITFINNNVMRKWSQIIYQVSKQDYKSNLRQMLKPTQKLIPYNQKKTQFIKDIQNKQKLSKISNLNDINLNNISKNISNQQQKSINIQKKNDNFSIINNSASYQSFHQSFQQNSINNKISIVKQNQSIKNNYFNKNNTISEDQSSKYQNYLIQANKINQKYQKDKQTQLFSFQNNQSKKEQSKIKIQQQINKQQHYNQKLLTVQNFLTNKNQINWYQYQSYTDLLTLYNQFIRECEKWAQMILKNYNNQIEYQHNLNKIGINMKIYLKYQKLQYKKNPIFVLHNYQYLMKILTSVKFRSANQYKIKIPFICLIQWNILTLLFKTNLPQNHKMISQNKSLEIIKNLQNKFAIKLNKQIKIYEFNNILTINDISQIIPLIEVNKNIIQIPFRYLLTNLNNRQDNLPDINILKDKLQYKMNSQDKIVSRIDLYQFLKYQGYNQTFLPQLYSINLNTILKSIVVTDLSLNVAQDFIYKQLQQFTSAVPQLQSIVLINSQLDIIYRHLTSYLTNINKQNNILLLKLVTETKKRYFIQFKNQDILIGYLASGIISNFHIQIQMGNQFYQNLSRENLKNFNINIIKYTPDCLGQQSIQFISRLKQQPKLQIYQNLLSTIQQSPIMEYFPQKIRQYLCIWIPPNSSNAQYHQIYHKINTIPPSTHSLKLVILSIKWNIKQKQFQLAQKLIFQFLQICKIWAPCSIFQFLSLSSIYNLQTGKILKAIKFAKQSVTLAQKYYGENSLLLGQKLYQLAEIYKESNSLKNAIQTYINVQKILNFHQREYLPSYPKILLKISEIYLAQNNNKESIECSLQVLKLFSLYTYQTFIQIRAFELLCRVHEINKEYNKLEQLGTLCLKKYKQQSQLSPEQFRLVLRIYVSSQIFCLKYYQKQALFAFIQSLSYKKHSQNQAQQLLKTVTFETIIKFKYLCNNILEIILINKQYSKTYKTFKFQNSPTDLIILLQAIVLIVGDNFIKGLLIY